MSHLNFIFKQSKDYFLNSQFAKAEAYILQNIAGVEDDHLPYAYDLIACSNYLLNNYDLALESIDKAIALKDDIVDFIITRGAILRNKGEVEASIYALLQADNLVKDPAINYNLRALSNQNQEIQAQTMLLSQNQKYNPNYQNWGGICPSFLKLETTRTDYVNECEATMLRICMDPLPEDEKEFKEHLIKCTQQIELRQMQQNNYGIKIKQKSILTMSVIKSMFKMYKQITEEVTLIQQREELLEKHKETLKIIQQSIVEEPAAAKELILGLQYKVSLYTEKETIIKTNFQSYKQAKKDTKILAEHTLQLSKSNEPDIQITITPENNFVYVNIDFKRKLEALKSLRQIKNIVGKSKQLYNLIWFIYLRTILACPKGIDKNMYLILRKGFNFIYQEVDADQQIKIDENQLTDITLRIFQKYNKIFESLPFTKQKTREIITSNCKDFQAHLQQIDLFFEQFLQNKQYITSLSEPLASQQTRIQQESFQRYYDLDQASFEDQIVENLVIIFYHFRYEGKKTHQLLMSAIVDMTIETKDNLNGRESFYSNFQQSLEQKHEGFFKKVFKKLFA